MKFSSLARPPISEAEAREVIAKDRTSICPYHNGLVRLTGDVEGATYFCPVGKQIWRYTAKPTHAGMYAPLNYQKSGAV